MSVHRSDTLTDKALGTSYHLLMLAVIILCLSLGFWQLERHDEKTQLLEQIRLGGIQPLDQATLEAQLWPDSRLSQGAVLAPYSQYQVYGLYDHQHSFLLDNRTYEGRVGYHLLTPFRLFGTPERWILVNRGWIEAPRLRSERPDFKTPQLPVSLQIQARALPEVPHPEPASTTAPVRLQHIATSQISALTQYPLPGYEFRLINTRQPGVQIPQPTRPAMQPEQHTGYAVQWFALAFTFSLLWARPLWQRHGKVPRD